MKNNLQIFLDYLNKHQNQAKIVFVFLGICIFMVVSSFCLALLIQSKHGCFGDILKAAISLL